MSGYSIDFALVCEGVTDHAVLKNILLGYFKDQPREPRFAQTDKKTARTTGCLNTLNSALARKNEPAINPDDKKVSPYHNASSGYRKRKDLLAEGPKNPSLKIFLDDLETRKIKLVADE